MLLVSYLFGGYVAGRMARRAGALNGLAVAILGLVIAAGVAALVRWSTDTESIVTSLRSLGVPTTADEYGQAFTVAGIASLAAVLIGAVLGGSWGERWHGKLLARAVDPTIGTEAAARERAQSEMARAEQERTGSFERARTTNPLRSRRADRDALAAASDRDADLVLNDDGTSTAARTTDRPRRARRADRDDLAAASYRDPDPNVLDDETFPVDGATPTTPTGRPSRRPRPGRWGDGAQV
jgi:hypothetical protein